MSFARHIIAPLLVSAVLFPLAFAQNDEGVDTSGGMLSKCSTNDDCAKGLICSIYIPNADEVRGCGKRNRCFCYTTDFQECVRADEDCEEGYQCFMPRFLEQKICSVCANNHFNVIDFNNNCQTALPCPTPTTTPTVSMSSSTSPSVSPSSTPSISMSPSVTPTPKGTVIDDLKTESASPSEGTPSLTPSISPSPTASLSDGATPSASPTASLSDGASQSPSPSQGGGEDEESETEEPPCVDARLLSHLSADDLVFAEHRRSHVLCDSNGSCATPGHVVVHDGRAMMMKSYCAKAGCVRSIKMVNSPRFRRGLRVSTHTGDLDFTAFAARYETRVEEAILTRLVHMGV